MIPFSSMKVFSKEVEDEYNGLFGSMIIHSWASTASEKIRAVALKNKSRYDFVSEKTKVPWFFIAIIHSLECSSSFQKHLHNGDRLFVSGVPQRTYRVPVGRGPFKNWEESAIDALTMKGIVNKNCDFWTVPRMLYLLERFNGLGYRRKSISIPTPYLWSGTNHYSVGKFVEDGKYDPSAVSKQVGAAILLDLFLSTEEAS